MPDYTPNHGISYPVPGDRVKDTSVAAKLAADIQATSLTADAAITTEGQRAENAAKEHADQAAWLKDVSIPAGASFADYIGTAQGEQVKGRVLRSNAATIGDWPEGLNRLDATFTSMAISSSVSLQTLQTHSFADPQLWIRSASGSGGQAWHRVGAPISDMIVDTLSSSQDLYELQISNGRSKQWIINVFPQDWEAQHFPDHVRGTVHLTRAATSAYYMTFLTLEDEPRLFIASRYGASWGPWKLVGAPSRPDNSGQLGRPASGMKRVGVPVTAGHFGGDAPLEGTVRMPLLYGAPITRWRLRFQNINTRSGVTRSGSVNISAVWLGKHSGNGGMTDRVSVADSFNVGDTNQEFVTPWCNTPLNAGEEYLLSFGYTASTAPWAMLGHAYVTDNPANAGATNPAGMTRRGTVPFTIAIEAETYATTPVVCSISDSNGVGVGAANGLHDSWLSQLCRRIKALPDHRGSSGDTMAGSLDGEAFKWTRFQDLDRPDVVLQALGQNDAAASGVTLTTLQNRLQDIIQNARTISPTVYLVNLMPRTTNPWEGFEAVRQSYNAWLLGLPYGARDVYDIASAISADDETIRPEYDADGIHLNADGFTAVQASFTRPVTSPPVMYEQI